MLVVGSKIMARVFLSLTLPSTYCRAALQVQITNTIDTYPASAQKSKFAHIFIAVFRRLTMKQKNTNNETI